jgi:HK97 family phage portal protein
MSLFWRKPEKRDTVPVPPFYNRLGPSNGYADIDVSTAEAPLQSIAVRGAVDLICSLASELPVEVFRGEGSARVKVPTPGYLTDPAGDGNGLADWIYQCCESWLLRGNLYSQVLARHPSNYITQAMPLHPDEVTPQIENGRVEWYLRGQRIPDLSHRRVNPVPGRLLGLSPVQLHARTIGLSLTSTQFGLQWFQDGANPSGMLTYEGELSQPVAESAKQRFLAAIRGSREPVVMGRGWRFEAISVSPEESQFLQTQGYTAAECARIFGPGIAEVLGYESGGSLTYATVESRSTHLLVYTLGKWFSRVERLLTDMLPRPQYARLNRNALLESTTIDRFRAHEVALRNAWTTINEVRAVEDAPPVEWGDVPYPPPPAPSAPAPEGGTDDDEPDE